MKKYCVLLAVLALVFQPFLLLAAETPKAPSASAEKKAPAALGEDDEWLGDEDFALDDEGEGTLDEFDTVAKPVAKLKP